MMQIEFLNPRMFLLSLLTIIPFMFSILRKSNLPSISIVPHDQLSLIFGAAIRLALFSALFCCLIAAAGPYQQGGNLEHTGEGAQIVMLIDRSASMNETFAGQNPSEVEESKAAASKRILLNFVDSRRHDLVGVVAFSTSPMFVTPLADHPSAVKSAILAMDRPGLDYTNIARGLSMALSLLRDNKTDTSKAVLLISDGAGVIDPKLMDDLRAEFLKTNCNLYWLYLRTKGSEGLASHNIDNLNQTSQESPEKHLNEFFRRLGVKYQAFEAEGPQQIEDAIRRIDSLERKPVQYIERLPRNDLTQIFLLMGFVSLIFILIVKLIEVDIDLTGRKL